MHRLAYILIAIAITFTIQVEAAQNGETTKLTKEALTARYLAQGDASYAEDRLDDALDAYRNAVKSMPGSSRAHQRLARVLGALGDLTGARIENERAIKLDPKNVDAHSNLGWVLGLQKKYREALAHEKKAVSIDPENVPALITLGLACTSLGDYQGAVAANEKVLALEPENLRAHINLGATLGRMGDYQRAAEIYTKALHLEPNSVRARLGLGACLGKLGELEGQVQQFKYAVELAPASAGAHGKLGWALYRSGDWLGAIKEGTITNWLRLKQSGPAFFKQFVWLWAGIFVLFGLIFGISFFGAGFKPAGDEKLLKSFYLVFHKDKPGRLVITDKRLVFVPEPFSRWFGSEEVSIDSSTVEKIYKSGTTRGANITITCTGGVGYFFKMPNLVFKPLSAELTKMDIMGEAPGSRPDAKTEEMKFPTVEDSKEEDSPYEAGEIIISVDTGQGEAEPAAGGMSAEEGNEGEEKES